MAEDINPREWTVLLSGEFTLPTGATRRAVVIEQSGGGNIRLKRARNIVWNNQSVRKVRLTFEEWPEEGGGDPEAVWPFNSYTGGLTVTPQAGSVTIDAGSSFNGRVAGTGRIVVKYTVTALTAEGQVDSTVLPLDPMIVVER